jgi:YD repeat-containing protein
MKACIQYSFLVLLLWAGYQNALFSQNINRPNIQGPANMEVNSFTGNLFHQRTDLFVPARGLPINMTFSYNAYRDTLDMGYGPGWTHPYNLCYAYDSTGQNMIVDRQDGRRDRFINNGPGFDPELGYFDEWDEYQSGKFRLRSKDGMEYYFDDASHQKLTGIQDPNGNRIEISYVAGLPVRIENTAGRELVLVWQAGKLQELRDNLSNPPRVYRYQYDSDGHMVKMTNPEGALVEYAYAQDKGMIQMSDENGNLFAVEYEDAGRVRRISSCISEMRISYSGTNETFVVEKGQSGTQVTSYTFDSDGKVIEKQGNCCGFETGYQYDAGNNVNQLTDANQQTTTYTYDNRGNRTGMTDALGNTASYTYDPIYNRLTSAVDKNGNFIQYQYDAQGNLTRIDRPGSITEIYGYDGLGNLISIQDGRGNSINMQYNATGDITRIDYPLGSESFVYDAVGNVTQSTDANGNTVQYRYDVMNRVTAVIDTEGNRLRYRYDAKGNLAERIDEDGRSHGYGYDALDRLVEVTTAAGITRYAYDQLGNMTSMTDANGNITRYTYDEDNLLSTETDAQGNVTAYSYDDKGNLILKQNPNGTVIS